MSSLKDKLMGGLDLVFLFGRGIERFSGTRHEALVSLIPMVVTFPLSLAFACVYPPKGMEHGYGYPQILFTIITHFVLAFALSNLLMAAFCVVFDRRDKFWLCFSAGNWTGFVLSIITSPLVFIACYGLIEREEMDRAFALVTIYAYIVTACVIFRALKINWQLAGALTIAMLFINQELSHALYILQGIPIPW